MLVNSWLGTPARAPGGGPTTHRRRPIAVTRRWNVATGARILARVCGPTHRRRAPGDHARQAAAQQHLTDARGRHCRRCGCRLARPYRAHDPSRLLAGDRRPPDRSRGRLLRTGRTDLGHKVSGDSIPLTRKPAPTLVRTGFQRGANGPRTPDPHTASVVRYQLRHSPVKWCPSKLHHLRLPLKTAGQGSSPPASGPSARAGVCSVVGSTRVSGARTQPTAPSSRMAPLITKAAPNVRCWAISPTANDPTIAPKSAII